MTGGGEGSKADVLRPLAGRLTALGDVAERAGLAYKTALVWAADGRIPGARKVGGRPCGPPSDRRSCGGSWRVPADQAEAWLRLWWDPATCTWEEWVFRNLGPGDGP